MFKKNFLSIKIILIVIAILFCACGNGNGNNNSNDVNNNETLQEDQTLRTALNVFLNSILTLQGSSEPACGVNNFSTGNISETSLELNGLGNGTCSLPDDIADTQLPEEPYFIECQLNGIVILGLPDHSCILQFHFPSYQVMLDCENSSGGTCGPDIYLEADDDTAECNDGIDNDDDGRIDYQPELFTTGVANPDFLNGDPHCNDIFDDSESS